MKHRAARLMLSPYALAAGMLFFAGSICVDLYVTQEERTYARERRARIDRIQTEAIAQRERMEAMLRELIERP